jgi:hypothetical protein
VLRNQVGKIFGQHQAVVGEIGEDHGIARSERIFCGENIIILSKKEENDILFDAVIDG